jgi:hypothetical protein
MLVALLSVVFAFGLGMTSALAAHASHACFDTDMLMKRFHRLFGEVVVGQGIVEKRNLAQLMVSPKKGTWTVVVKMPPGDKTCLIMSGTDWEFGVKPIWTVPIAVEETSCTNPDQTELDIGLWYAQRKRTVHIERRLVGKKAEKLLEIYNALPEKTNVVGDLILVFVERPGSPVVMVVFRDNCHVIGFSAPYEVYKWILKELEG